MTFRFTTAGESHGRGLAAIVEGIPAGLPVDAAWVNAELKRRMAGYGRGARMKIEADEIEWLAGVRAGETIGAPIAMLIWNRDWEHWQDVMAPEAAARRGAAPAQVTRPRPGHADLTGALKYDREDARDILERASARETAARVACGAVCKRLLDEFGIEIGSHVVELGGVDRRAPRRPLPSAVERGRRRESGALPRSGGRARDGRAHRRGQGGRGHAGRRRRGGGARPSRGARVPRLLGPQARRPPGAGHHVHSSREGRRAGLRVRGGAPAGLGGPRRDPPGLQPRHESRGRHRGRHDDRASRWCCTPR